MIRPDFDDLIGPDVAGGERERLRRVHELLLEAGPPPELSPALAAGVDPESGTVRRERTIRAFPRRRLLASLAFAAAFALAAFGGGYVFGERQSDPFATDYVISMRGTSAAPAARAVIAIGEKDEGGNWPMEMTVRGLPQLPRGELYELFLTERGRRTESCGVFAVEPGRTVVYLNAPYRLRGAGWVVTRHGSDEILLRTERL